MFAGGIGEETSRGEAALEDAGETYGPELRRYGMGEVARWVDVPSSTFSVTVRSQLTHFTKIVPRSKGDERCP